MAYGTSFDRRARDRVKADLDGPGLAGITLEIAELLKGFEVGVDGRWGGQADCLADLPDRWGIPPLTSFGVDVIQDLPLAVGEALLAHRGLLPLVGRSRVSFAGVGIERMFATMVSMIERLYDAHMFPEHAFRVKDSSCRPGNPGLAGPQGTQRCLTLPRNWTP